MKKKERQKLLTQLMEEQDIKRQEDFVDALKDYGIPVTQATISRDIKDMHLVKVPSTTGEGYRYSLPLPQADDALPRLKKVLKNSFITCDCQENLVALKTQPGTGPALSHLLERTFQEEIFTLLTDDNHVLLIARDVELAAQIRDDITEYAQP